MGGSLRKRPLEQGVCVWALRRCAYSTTHLSSPTPAPWGRKCRSPTALALAEAASWKAVDSLSLPGSQALEVVVVVWRLLTVCLGVLLSCLHPS